MRHKGTVRCTRVFAFFACCESQSCVAILKQQMRHKGTVRYTHVFAFFACCESQSYIAFLKQQMRYKGLVRYTHVYLLCLLQVTKLRCLFVTANEVQRSSLDAHVCAFFACCETQSFTISGTIVASFYLCHAWRVNHCVLSFCPLLCKRSSAPPIPFKKLCCSSFSTSFVQQNDTYMSIYMHEQDETPCKFSKRNLHMLHIHPHAGALCVWCPISVLSSHIHSHTGTVWSWCPHSPSPFRGHCKSHWPWWERSEHQLFGYMFQPHRRAATCRRRCNNSRCSCSFLFHLLDAWN